MGSASPPFPVAIPEEYRGELEYAEVTDTRSDDEILASLGQHVPVTSEKSVWAYWDKGVAAIPGWCKRNVTNWVRILGPSWTVRVLDTVTESPNHALKYIPPKFLPEAFANGTMDGPYVGPHSADFIRGATLYVHGGVFMDVGILMIRHLDRVCWSALADEQTPYNVFVPVMYGQTIANHFVASRKGDPIIKRW
jgi:mannosyltransferase OCH1-like enzyme